MICLSRRLVYRKGDVFKKDVPLPSQTAEQGKLKRIAKTDITVRCGRCYNCRRTKISEWCFRLVEEQSVSYSSHFVTLTYAPEHLPKTESGLSTLRRLDLVQFMKNIRGYQKRKIKIYAVGEYGTLRKRPHYHLIMFNLEDELSIPKAWKKGNVHIDKVNKNTIAYTVDYLDKDKKVPQWKGDDREKEFASQSRGLGLSYLTDSMKKYYLEDIKRCHVVGKDGKKIFIPRYYKKNIPYTDQDKLDQIEHIIKVMDRKKKEEEIYVQRMYKGKITWHEWNDARLEKQKLLSNNKIREL